MISRKRKVLGLAVEESGILVAQLHPNREQFECKATAEFTWPENALYDNSEKVGFLLNQFLRQNHFNAIEAVIGFPAKWLIVCKKEIPPTNAEMMNDIITLQAERELSMDFNDLVFDYIDGNGSAQNRGFLLVATLREKMDRIVAITRAAGLKVLSVTSSSMALTAGCSELNPAARYMLYLRPHYAELLVENSAGFCSLKHLAWTESIGDDPDKIVESLSRELRQFASIIPDKTGVSKADTLLLWDGAGMGPELGRKLRHQLSGSLQICDGYHESVMSKTILSEQAANGRFAAAIHLVLSSIQSESPTIDFLNSRISPRQKNSRQRKIVWTTLLVVTLLLYGFSMLWDWKNDKQEILTLTKRLEEMKEDIVSAQDFVDKVSFARNWYSGRPGFLNCLRELTLSFPEEGSIWVTSLAMRENMRGIISGKSRGEASVLEVLDKLKANRAFSNVKMLYMRETSRNSQDVSFAIDFVFTKRK